MHKIILSIASCLLTVVTVNTAFGQAVQPPPTQGLPSQQAVPSSWGVELTVSPRFWYNFVNSPAGKSQKTFIQSSEFVGLPMVGSALSARFDSLPDTTFIGSALWGAGRLNSNFLSVGDTRTGAARFDVNRYDFEMLAQTAIPDTNWAWIVGARYEYETLPESFIEFQHSGPALVKSNGPSLNTYTVKAGMAGAAPITPSGDLRMFGNILVLGGPEFVAGNNVAAEIGKDMAVGLQYVATSAVSFDLRYRGIVSFHVGLPPGSQAFYISQGPMVGLNVKF